MIISFWFHFETFEFENIYITKLYFDAKYIIQRLSFLNKEWTKQEINIPLKITRNITINITITGLVDDKIDSPQQQPFS